MSFDPAPASSGQTQNEALGERRRRQLAAEYAADIARLAEEASSRLEDWVLLLIASDDSVGCLLVDHYGLAKGALPQQAFYLVPKPYDEAAAWFPGDSARETFRKSLPPGVTASGLFVHLAVIAFEGVSLLEVAL